MLEAWSGVIYFKLIRDGCLGLEIWEVVVVWHANLVQLSVRGKYGDQHNTGGLLNPSTEGEEEVKGETWVCVFVTGGRGR